MRHHVNSASSFMPARGAGSWTLAQAGLPGIVICRRATCTFTSRSPWRARQVAKGIVEAWAWIAMMHQARAEELRGKGKVMVLLRVVYEQARAHDLQAHPHR